MYCLALHSTMNFDDVISKISDAGNIYWIHEIDNDIFLFLKNKCILKIRSNCDKDNENKVIVTVHWKPYKSGKHVNATSISTYFNGNEIAFLEGIPQVSTCGIPQMPSWFKNSAPSWFKNSASSCDSQSYFIDGSISEHSFLEGIPQYEKYSSDLDRIIKECGDF